MRGISEKNILDEFCIKFCKVLEKQCRYIVVSGFVAISSGRSRATEDIDIVIEKLDFRAFKELHNDLLKKSFVCMQSDSAEEIYDYLIDNTSVRYTLKDKPLPEAELKFAKDKIDQIQLESRVKLPLTGLDIWFSSINMNLAFKEELLKSDKDVKDAEHLRKIYPELVNEDEINKIKLMIRKLRL